MTFNVKAFSKMKNHHTDIKQNDNQYNNNQHNDIQHTDIKQNDNQYNNNQHNNIQHNDINSYGNRHNDISVDCFIVTMSVIYAECHNECRVFYAECRQAKCRSADSRGAFADIL
jgi:hypothetical protein